MGRNCSAMERQSSNIWDKMGICCILLCFFFLDFSILFAYQTVKTKYRFVCFIIFLCFFFSFHFGEMAMLMICDARSNKRGEDGEVGGETEMKPKPQCETRNDSCYLCQPITINSFRIELPVCALHINLRQNRAFTPISQRDSVTITLSV